jgi:hypothetical protein
MKMKRHGSGPKNIQYGEKKEDCVLDVEPPSHSTGKAHASKPFELTVMSVTQRISSLASIDTPSGPRGYCSLRYATLRMER